MQFFSMINYPNQQVHLLYFNEVCQNETNPEKLANIDFNQYFCITLWEKSHCIEFICLHYLFCFAVCSFFLQQSSIATTSECSQQTLQDQHADLRYFPLWIWEKWRTSFVSISSHLLLYVTSGLQSLSQSAHASSPNHVFLSSAQLPKICCKASSLKCSWTLYNLQLTLINAWFRHFFFLKFTVTTSPYCIYPVLTLPFSPDFSIKCPSKPYSVFFHHSIDYFSPTHLL